ncbi:protein SanA [Marixanthomonas spongiae]|uniref:Protein SanA n=2 Tax=Marixanthomonas spongiae TaxID=2174845 RepID=A0A2U0HYR8_9FLAO|nr:protein SanA [Marixanthomonas spongiae]
MAYTLFLVLLAVFLFMFISNYTIGHAAKGKTFNTISEIGKNKVGLVLGTSKRLKNGQINPYFTYRIDAAVALYQQGKIDFILVSGDNATKYYNEPMDFKRALVKRGVPEAVIYLDYAGFRTLDSVVRAKEVFGQEHITVISQKFHNQRAIYLAEKNGMTAIGFNAEDVAGKNGLKVKIRGYFARTKVFLDLLFHVEPKFYGKKIIIKPKTDTLTFQTHSAQLSCWLKPTINS